MTRTARAAIVLLDELETEIEMDFIDLKSFVVPDETEVKSFGLIAMEFDKPDDVVNEIRYQYHLPYRYVD